MRRLPAKHARVSKIRHLQERKPQKAAFGVVFVESGRKANTSFLYFVLCMTQTVHLSRATLQCTVASAHVSMYNKLNLRGEPEAAFSKGDTNVKSPYEARQASIVLPDKRD